MKQKTEERFTAPVSKLARKINIIEQKSFDVPQAFAKDKLREDLNTMEEKIR